MIYDSDHDEDGTYERMMNEMMPEENDTTETFEYSDNDIDVIIVSDDDDESIITISSDDMNPTPPPSWDATSDDSDDSDDFDDSDDDDYIPQHKRFRVIDF